MYDMLIVYSNWSYRWLSI